jgi:pyridinium-3,5-biscarboxylic acid mononucleotide sulfurtransferase
MATRPPLTASVLSEAELVRRIRTGGPALVALSGGVDSSLVAALAKDALGDAAVAVTLSGPAVSRSELDRARRVAATVGISHRVVPADPLAREEYRQNPSNRCYFCRAVETEALRRVGAESGIAQYLDGVHRDDLADDRPGLRAMDEAGFLHPLVWAGWGKSEVRDAARRRGLPNWDQPSDACLASRVAHGEPITEALLGRIEAAEAVLLGLGFRRVRVRVRAGGARVEVGPEEVHRLTTEPLRSTVLEQLRGFGFDPVTIDPRGYGQRPDTLPMHP